MHPAFAPLDAGSSAQRPFDEVPTAAEPAALGSAADARGAPADFVDGLVTHRRQRRSGASARASAVHVYVRQPLDDATASSTTPTASC